MSIDFGRAYEIFIENWSLFSYGIQNTLLFAIVGTVVGLILGLITGALRAIPEDPMDSLPVKILKKLARWIVGFYVWFFRGTPMMVTGLVLFLLASSDFRMDRFLGRFDHHFSQYGCLYGGNYSWWYSVD